jgi:hypothetical protein
MASFYLAFLNQKASVENQGNHSVCWVPSDMFNQLPIRRWKFNRPCDEERVAEIREHMNTSRRLDGVIYLACINNELVCYESNHRREALKGIGTIHNILVDVLWNATDEMVKEEFVRLNKAVCVPELYLEDTTTLNIDEIRKIVDSFCKNYKMLKVNSGRPQRPNFNRDMVTDEFTRIMREKNMTPSEFETWITEYNNELSNKDKSNLSEKVIKKCQESGLWLFAWSSKL